MEQSSCRPLVALAPGMCMCTVFATRFRPSLPPTPPTCRSALCLPSAAPSASAPWRAPTPAAPLWSSARPRRRVSSRPTVPLGMPPLRPCCSFFLCLLLPRARCAASAPAGASTAASGKEGGGSHALVFHFGRCRPLSNHFPSRLPLLAAKAVGMTGVSLLNQPLRVELAAEAKKAADAVAVNPVGCL